MAALSGGSFMDKKQSTQRWFENVVYMLCIAVFSYLLSSAMSVKPRAYDGMQSMTFPKIIFSLVILLCVIKLIGNIISMIKDKELSFERADTRVFISLLMIIIYAVMWKLIGFGASSVLFVSAEAKLLRSQVKWWKAAAVGAGSTAVLYFIFGFLFNVDFPEPIISLIFG